MPTCDVCGKRFNADKAEEDFQAELGMSLIYDDHFDKTLCFKCAMEAFENKEYYEVCENCGKRFNVIEELTQLQMTTNDYSLDTSDFDSILCAECAYEEWESWQE